MLREFLYIFIICNILCGLGACSLVTAGSSYMPNMVGLDGVTLITTNKTINDHIVSFSTGKNCSTVRKNTGRHYCEEDEVVAPDEVYCYPTLGDVSCYARPSPHGENSPSLGQIKPNARAPR